MNLIRSLSVILASTFGFTFFAAEGLAGEDIDQSKDAASDGLVEVINARGEVEITGWDEDRIQIEGELDDLAEALIFDVDGNVARIEVRIPRHNANWGDGSNLTIHVPSGSRVSFEGVSADASVSNVKGGIQLRTASGDIEAKSIASQINIKSVSGDIEVRDSSGQANVSSVSGEIILNISSERISLNTVSGDVEAKLGHFERLFANAISGDIEISGALMKDSEIDISSVSSDVSLALASPIDAAISIETGPGGDITNDLNDEKVVTRFPAMKGLRTTVGDGSANINLRTVSGDIELDSIE